MSGPELVIRRVDAANAEYLIHSPPARAASFQKHGSEQAGRREEACWILTTLYYAILYFAPWILSKVAIQALLPQSDQRSKAMETEHSIKHRGFVTTVS